MKSNHQTRAVPQKGMNASRGFHRLSPGRKTAARDSRPLEVYEKTFLVAPLAAKFQLDRAPQARGLLVATVAPQGVVRAEIRWFSAPQGDVLKAVSW